MNARSAKIAASAALLLASAICASAQPATDATYPNQPIRIVVPFTPGGTSDILARGIGQRLSDALGQPVVVDNRAGGGANIGATHVAKSAPDGYTLFVISTVHAINATLYTRLAYDPVRDFTPIALIAETSQVLVVDPDLPVRSVADFIAYAKARPGALNYATVGSGSQPHLSAVLFDRMTGISMTHVPYRGAAEAMTGLLGKHVHLTFATAPSAVPFVKSGQLRALAVTTPARIAALPDVPTMIEAGVPGYVVAGWNGLVGPVGMPAAIVDKLNAAVVKSVKEPAMQRFLLEQGAEPRTGAPQEFGAYIRDEVDKWAKVVRDSGAQVE
jgi:tripartite-type tricarboxylate transporter receptor subunit TctC